MAQGGDQETAAGRAAGREHLQEVLGKDDPGGLLAAKIGIGKDAVMTAIAKGDEPEELGTRLARADAERDLSPAEVESVLRELRQLAQAMTDRTVDAQPEEMQAPMRTALGDLVIEGYYQRFTASFDTAHVKRRFADVLVGKAGAEEKSLASLGISVEQARELTGTSGDVVRNQALLCPTRDSCRSGRSCTSRSTASPGTCRASGRSSRARRGPRWKRSPSNTAG